MSRTMILHNNEKRYSQIGKKLNEFNDFSEYVRIFFRIFFFLG